MKCLTIKQPHVQLVVMGIKTLETRSWPAPAGLVGERLLLHAAAKRPVDMTLGDWRVVTYPDRRTVLARLDRRSCWDNATIDSTAIALPLGAIVGSAVLDACVPMVDDRFARNVLDVGHPGETVMALRIDDRQGVERITDVTDQLPYGDFAPGRWAWILRDAAPTTERCPLGCQIIALDGEDDHAAERDGYRIQTGSLKIGGGTLTSWDTCPACKGAGSCPPIPWKGRQRVWRCVL